MTYGTASAPFLAVRCLQQIAVEYMSAFPEASKIILQDFYVDDLITGSETIKGARLLKEQIVNILNEYKFPLRKFKYNQKKLTDDESMDDNTLQYKIAHDSTIKTLGLLWNPEQGTFSYVFNKFTHQTLTKRQILSTISKLFDPLGLVGPVIVRAKLIIQKLCECKLGWDESVPMEIFTSWKTFCQHLNGINELQIPRQVTIPEYKQTELHGFCDASEQAYGACVFVVTITNETFFKNIMCKITHCAFKINIVTAIRAMWHIIVDKIVKKD